MLINIYPRLNNLIMHNNLYETKTDQIDRWWRQLTSDRFIEMYNLTGLDFIKKYTTAELRRLRWRHEQLQKRFNETTSAEDIASDNWFRFTFGALLDRLSVVRQTSLFTSFEAVKGLDSLSSNFSMSGMGRLARGALRGNFLNTLQFLGVQTQALMLSDRSLSSFLGYYLILDSVLHPLDTLRTRWTADSSNQFRNLSECARSTPFSQLYNGFIFRGIFSGILAAYYLATSSENYNSFIGVGLLSLAYPFQTLKSISQVSGSSASGFTGFASLNPSAGAERTVAYFRVLYRGFVPFLALNLLAPYYFPQIWNKSKQERELSDALHDFNDLLKDKKSVY